MPPSTMGLMDNYFRGMSLRTSLVCGAVFLLAVVYKQTRRKKGLPPGPPAIPILGSLPFLGREFRKIFLQLRRRYGDIITVQLGQFDVVVLNGYDVIKDALVNHSYAFSGRAQDFSLFKKTSNGRGIVLNQGESWRQQRKFTHGVLKDFGMGRHLLEDRIKEELDFLTKRLCEHAETPYDMTDLLHNAVSNIICSIMFGKRFEYDDPMYKTQMEIIITGFKILGTNNPAMLIPWLGYLPGDLFGVQKFLVKWKQLKEICQGKIDEHKARELHGEPGDFIDAYLQQMEKEKDNKESLLNADDLLMIIINMFAAGTETTTTTLRWAILFLLHNPEVKEKVCQEIKEVLGERLPTMRDKANMPYTEATLMEVQRVGDIAPFAVLHCISEDVSFHGYHLPKGTLVSPNLSSVHQDPQIWDDPEKFDPTRFLGPDGKAEKNEHLIPFSMGKRVCLGESMARMELFLFFTTLLQRFNIMVPPGHILPDLKGVLGIAYSPKQYDVWLVPQS